MQRRVIFTSLILVDHRDHGVWSDKARDVVDVAVSIVAGDSAIEPDDGLHSQIIGKHLLIGGAIHGRIALLNAGEQAFFSGKERAATVDVDRSAFEDGAALFPSRLHETSTRGLRHALAIFLVRL